MKAVRHQRHTAASRKIESRPLDDLLAVRVVRLSEAIASLVELSFADLQLRMADLRVLSMAGPNRATCVAEIAAQTQIDKAWISRTVNRLQERGLLTCSTTHTDNRVRLIRLTDQGLAIWRKLAPMAIRREEEMLTSIDLSALMACLHQVDANVRTRFRRGTSF